MKKKEFESKMKKLHYKRVHNKGEESDFCDYYVNPKELNIYGINKDKDVFVAFYKDSERGIVTEIGRFKNDEDAYGKLMETVDSWEEHKKG